MVQQFFSECIHRLGSIGLRQLGEGRICEWADGIRPNAARQGAQGRAGGIDFPKKGRVAILSLFIQSSI